jgi:hypothetical protein
MDVVGRAEYSTRGDALRWQAPEGERPHPARQPTDCDRRFGDEGLYLWASR